MCWNEFEGGGGGSNLKTPDSVNQSPEDSVHITIVIELQSDEMKSPLGTGNVWPEIQEALSGAKDQSPPAAQSVKSENIAGNVNITLYISFMSVVGKNMASFEI